MAGYKYCGVGVYKKCAACKKKFYIEDRALYAWKHNGKYCCCYSCMRALETGAKKKSYGPRRQPQDLPNQRIRQATKQAGLQNKDVARLIGLTTAQYSAMICNREVPEEKTEKILLAIRQATEGREAM